MPSKPDKGIQGEQDTSVMNSPGVITRSQLRRMSLVKVDAVKSSLAFEDNTDFKNFTRSTHIDVKPILDEVTSQPVSKGRKRNESDTVDKGVNQNLNELLSQPVAKGRKRKELDTLDEGVNQNLNQILSQPVAKGRKQKELDTLDEGVNENLNELSSQPVAKGRKRKELDTLDEGVNQNLNQILSQPVAKGRKRKELDTLDEGVNENLNEVSSQPVAKGRKRKELDTLDEGVNQNFEEETLQPVTKGIKRKESPDTVADRGSGRKTSKVQETPEAPLKTEKSKATRKPSPSLVKKNVKGIASLEPDIMKEISDKKKTAQPRKKKNSNKSDDGKTLLVEKLLADMKKDLDSGSTTYDDSSSQKSYKMKSDKKEAELSNKEVQGKKVAPKSSQSSADILESLVPKIKIESPAKKVELLVPVIKKEVSPSKLKEETITQKLPKTSIGGDTDGLSVKPDPQTGTLDERRSSLPPSTGSNENNQVKGGSRTREDDSSDTKPGYVVNLNKSLEISNILYSVTKAEEVSDSLDIKPSKVANLNNFLEIANVDSGSKASEVSGNSDIKQKKLVNLNKSFGGVSTPPKDGGKVKIKENDKSLINPTVKADDEVKNSNVPVAGNILKPLVKFSPTPQKVTPWNHSPAQLSWQPIKLTDGTSESDSDAESRKAIMESAQRRIEQNLSTSESESRFLQRIQPCLSDSDSAPECVSFQASSRAASESLKNAVQSIQRDKQRRKEKRRARLEMLKQQKEEKLIRLKEKLASQVDASCSSSEESGYEEEASKLYKYNKQPVGKAKGSVEKENCVISELKKSFASEVGADCLLQASKEVPQNNLKSLPSDVLDKLPEKVFPKELKADAAISKIKKRKKEEEDSFRDSLKGVPAFKKPSTATDFIPLKSSGATKFGVVALDKLGMAPKPISSLAADFKQNMLFGNRHKREPAKVGIAYQQKLQASGRNVFARKKF